MKYKNTLQKGSARFIIFREGDSWYGVCLDFNIIEAGDTPQEAMLLLSEAIEGYLESARKVKARPYILNQKLDSEYEEMWDRIEEKKTLSKEVFSFGSFNIMNSAFASV